MRYIACILSSVLLALAPLSVHSLSCPDVCNQSDCLKSPSKCAYGIIKDACNCCSYCGNGPGEQCGGEFNILGMCGKGMECLSNNAMEPSIFPEGTCVWKKKAPVPGNKPRMEGLQFVPRRQHWMNKSPWKKFGNYRNKKPADQSP